MKFNSIMHVSFYTNRWDEMIDFYVNKLGLKQKVIVRYKEYLHADDRPQLQKLAKENPEGIFYTYIEIAEGQFIELFPGNANQLPHRKWNEDIGYSHFALMVDDIFETSKQLQQVGITPDTNISKGPSGTYQQWFSDPDGNKFELMQYTETSFQIIGHI